jgi:hypothetical protein
MRDQIFVAIFSILLVIAIIMSDEILIFILVILLAIAMIVAFRREK